MKNAKRLEKNSFIRIGNAIRRANRLARENKGNTAYILDMVACQAPLELGNYAVVMLTENDHPDDHNFSRETSVYCVRNITKKESK